MVRQAPSSEIEVERGARTDAPETRYNSHQLPGDVDAKRTPPLVRQPSGQTALGKQDRPTKALADPGGPWNPTVRYARISSQPWHCTQFYRCFGEDDPDAIAPCKSRGYDGEVRPLDFARAARKCGESGRVFAVRCGQLGNQRQPYQLGGW